MIDGLSGLAQFKRIAETAAPSIRQRYGGLKAP